MADASPFEQTQTISYGVAHADDRGTFDVAHAATASETKVGEDVVESGVFEYDGAGRQTKRTMTSAADGVTTEDLMWDVASNLVSSVVSDGVHENYWTYLYDAGGNLTQTTRPTGVVTSTQFDLVGRLRGSVRMGNAHSASTVAWLAPMTV